MIQSIRLQHFRSYDDDSFEFNDGVNIIVGPNASGKTNLLEALLVVSRGSSYRAHDIDLVEHNEPWARLDALVDGAQRTVKLTRDPVPEKIYEIEGRSFKHLSLERTVPVVLFEPNYLLLLHGSLEGRCDYFDSLLEQTQHGFSTLRRDYCRALAQCNVLLKRGEHVAYQQIFP